MLKFDDETTKYLQGKLFSNGLEFIVSNRNSDLADRLSILEAIVRKKRIIHIGCVDHLPLIESKIVQGRWLHARLCSSAERCLGIDINANGIDYIKNKLGYTDVFQADLLVDSVPSITSNDWDYIVLGEILEHVDNPVLFLKEISRKYSACVKRMIITVPNAFSLINFQKALANKEFINTDHRYWFTPYTLGKVLTQAGLTVNGFEFCESQIVRTIPTLSIKHYFHLKTRVIRYLVQTYPALRETLIMEASL